jgi:hypothetical protein
MSSPRHNVPTDILQAFARLERLAHHTIYNMHRYELSAPIVPFGDTDEFNVIKPAVPVPFAGLVFYILDPVDQNDNDLKVLFRGTKCLGSIIRDLDNDAPGSASFQSSLMHLMDSFNKALRKIARRHETISITIGGHSLGAADAQYFCAALLRQMYHVYNQDEAILDPRYAKHFKKIKTIRLAGFNSPGITHKLVAQANEDAIWLREKKYLTDIQCYWLHSGGDFVQQTGQEIIFANLAFDVVKIHLIKARHQMVQENSWQNFFSFSEIKTAISHSITAHRAHFFNGGGEHVFQYFCNENPDEALIIQKKLARKQKVGSILYYLQQFTRTILNLSFYINTGTSYTYNSQHDKHLKISADWMIVLPQQTARLLNSNHLKIDMLMFNNYYQPFYIPNIHRNNLSINLRQRPRIKIELLDDKGQPVEQLPRKPGRKTRLITCALPPNFNANPNVPATKPIVSPVQSEAPEIKYMSVANKNKLIKMLNHYISSRSNSVKKVELSFITRVFRNSELTRKKLLIALKLKNSISVTYDEVAILAAIAIAKLDNVNTEKQHNKKYKYTKSRFGECLDSLTAELTDQPAVKFTLPTVSASA